MNKTNLISKNLLWYIQLATSDILNIYGVTDESKLLNGQSEWHQFVERSLETTNQIEGIDNFLQKNGFTCSSILKTCSFAGRNFDCCQYAKAIPTSNGLCYLMDFSKSDKWMQNQTQGGEYAGLTVILDANKGQIMKLSSDALDDLPIQIDNGFKVYIDDRGTIPFATSHGLTVSPGNSLYAAITTKEYKLMKGTCQTELIGKDGTKKYRIEDCVAKCKAKAFNKNCFCSPLQFNLGLEYRTCTPLEVKRCVQSHFLKDGMVLEQECNHCTPGCERMDYNLYTSYSSGFSSDALRWLSRKNSAWNVEIVHQNLVVVNVFLREMAITRLEQILAIQPMQLLGSIGGAIGLFLGLSIITILEALIYACKMILKTILRNVRKSNDEEENQQQDETTQKAFNQLMETMKRTMEGPPLYSEQKNMSTQTNEE